MNQQDFNAFLAGLRNGLGFTKSCQILRQDPKTMSEYLRADRGLLVQASEAVIYAAKALLVNGSTLLQQTKLKEWQANMARIETFVHALTLWEDHCSKAEANAAKLLEAYLLYKDWDEVATATGHTRVELNHVLLHQKGILNYIRENDFFFNR